MIWIYNKEDLQYYHQTEVKCYCDTLGYPSDMLLQGSWPVGLISSFDYTFQAEVWNVSGTTALEVINPDYYQFYFAKDPITGNHFFTFRLKSYTAVMCATKCFLIRIGISYNGLLPTTYVFAAWTEQYCIKSCCDNPRGIIVNGEGAISYDVPGETVSNVPTGPCGQKLIRLIATADCYNPANGKYYGQPAVYSGTYIPYMDIHVMQGRIVQRPRNIERIISYNCVVQRVESSKQFLLEGQEGFPAWKMNEIEDSFYGNRIFVDDFYSYKEFVPPTGAMFERIEIPKSCIEIFKLNPILEECPIRVTYGCTVSCVENANFGTFFVVPDNYQGGYFYDGNSNIIANDLSGLFQWFQSIGLNPAIMGSVPCNVTQILQVTGAVIPPVIYYDTVSFATAINPLTVDFTEICDFISEAFCDAPIIGTISEGDMPCDAPVIGTITEGDITPTQFAILDASPWIIETDMPTSIGELVDTQAKILVRSRKPVSGLIGEIYGVAYEVIANTEALGWPSSPQTITSGTDNLSNLAPGWQIDINTDGTVRFTGSLTILVDNVAQIDLSNLYYNI